MGIIRAIKSHNLKKKVSKMDAKTVDKEIRIQGTYFDRKRVCTKEDLKFAKKYLKKGFSHNQIANMLDMDVRTLRYNLDPEYRLRRLSQCTGKHTGNTYYDFNNRVSYKTALVYSGDYVK